MTNYEFLQRLNPEELARFLTEIEEEGESEAEWLEWLNAPINVQQWDEIMGI
ncbi:MAG: hypothetical protein IKG23_08545 [Clostridia bacterium]|nr:hypothetical protein [Clostridia bacterium]